VRLDSFRRETKFLELFETSESKGVRTGIVASFVLGDVSSWSLEGPCENEGRGESEGAIWAGRGGGKEERTVRSSVGEVSEEGFGLISSFELGDEF